MTLADIYNYINTHQDDKEADIARALGVTEAVAKDYIFSWALYSEESFIKRYEDK